MRLTGHDAISHATAHGLTLCKFADPIEDAREGLSVTEAREVVAEDPSLIYLDCSGYESEQSSFNDHMGAAHLYAEQGLYTAGDAEHKAALAIYRQLVNAAWQPGCRPDDVIAEMSAALDEYCPPR